MYSYTLGIFVGALKNPVGKTDESLIATKYKKSISSWSNTSAQWFIQILAIICELKLAIPMRGLRASYSNNIENRLLLGVFIVIGKYFCSVDILRLSIDFTLGIVYHPSYYVFCGTIRALGIATSNQTILA